MESQTDLDQTTVTQYIARVPIRIQRPTGGPYLGNRLTKRDLLMDIATDFGFLDYKAGGIHRQRSPEFWSGRQLRAAPPSRAAAGLTLEAMERRPRASADRQLARVPRSPHLVRRALCDFTQI